MILLHCPPRKSTSDLTKRSQCSAASRSTRGFGVGARRLSSPRKAGGHAGRRDARRADRRHGSHCVGNERGWRSRKAHAEYASRILPAGTQPSPPRPKRFPLCTQRLGFERLSRLWVGLGFPQGLTGHRPALTTLRVSLTVDPAFPQPLRASAYVGHLRRPPMDNHPTITLYCWSIWRVGHKHPNNHPNNHPRARGSLPGDCWELGFKKVFAGEAF